MTTLLKGAPAIRSMITSIYKEGRLLDESIQLAAMSCINHASEHGDITLCCELFKALPKGARAKALTEWFLQFGQVQVSTGIKAKELPFVLDRTKELNLVAGEAKPWYTCKPEKHPSEEFDLVEAMKALLTRADAAAKKGLTIKGQEKLMNLRVLAGTISAPVEQTQANDTTEQEAA